MTKEEMIVGMQMNLKSGITIDPFLFKSFTVTTWWSFVLVLLFTTFFAFASETAGYILRTKHSKLNALVFGLLRVVNYSQMLMVMTYNIWVILTLVVFQTGFSVMYRVLE